MNQRDNWLSGDPSKQVRCIYVAVGQKGSTIASVRSTLEENGAMDYTTIIASPASDPAGFKYLAPYTGSIFFLWIRPSSTISRYFSVTEISLNGLP